MLLDLILHFKIQIKVISSKFSKFGNSGGIFPISGSKFTAPELGPVAIMAVADINKNPNILAGHKLMLDIQDGQCEADIVMKKFIDFIKNKDPSRFRRTVGILGESRSHQIVQLLTDTIY